MLHPTPLLWGKLVNDPIQKPEFWHDKDLSELSGEEWEALCDGCGRCCLNKLEEEDTGEIYWTDVHCILLDADKCRCKNYGNRQEQVPDCIPLSPDNVSEISWLPPTCAYRLRSEGRELYWWHYLISGSRETVHEAGISVRGRTVSEKDYPVEQFEERLVDWPGEKPENS